MADFGGKSGVAGEEGLKRAVLDQENQRVLVDVLPPARPPGHGCRTVKVTPSRVNRSPARAGCQGIRFPAAPRGRQCTADPRTIVAGLEHEACAKPCQNRRHATEMVGVCVRDHDQRQAPGAVPRKERRHHSAAGIAALAGRPGIDHDPVPRRRPEDRRIALADVEKM